MHFVDAKSPLSRWNGMNVYRGCAHGCAYCGNTGYSGRTAIYEMLSVTDDVRGLLMKGEGEADIYRHLKSSAPDLTLRGDALAKVLEGETTLEEYHATVAEDIDMSGEALDG